MDKKEFAKLKVGDKVRIVSEKPFAGWSDSMDKYLGAVMTIRERKNIWDWDCLFMLEDQEDVPNGTFGKGFIWFDHMIAEKVKPVKEVKRKAKVGEWIKIVYDNSIKGKPKKGDILQVYKIAEYSTGQTDGVYCELPNKCSSIWRNDKGNIIVLDYEYVVLENYVPEEKASTKPEPKKTEEQPVTIVEHLVKDRKTIVKLSNGKVGVAVCSPEDEFDIFEGLKLATERAYGRAEPYKKVKPVKEVKRKAKKGEYIKIVNRLRTEMRYMNGAIFKVVDDVASWGGKDCVQVDCGCFGRVTVRDSEYVVLENYKPTK